MERTSPRRRLLCSLIAGVVLTVVVTSCGSTPDRAEETKTTDTGSTTGSTVTTDTTVTGSTVPPPNAPTSVAGTGCQLAPATTTPFDQGGGHITCDPGSPPFPPETKVPSADPGGGVITGTLAEEGTGAVLPGVVLVEELHAAVASGADGRFGLAVPPGTYHLGAIVNRDVSYTCTTPTVVVTEHQVATVPLTCRH